MFQICKKAGKYNPYVEKNYSIVTDPEMTLVIKLYKNVKTVIISILYLFRKLGG